MLFKFKAIFPKNWKKHCKYHNCSCIVFHCPLDPPLFLGGLAATDTLRQPRFHCPATEYCFNQKIKFGRGTSPMWPWKNLLTSKSCPSKDNSFIFRNIFFPFSSKDKGDIVASFNELENVACCPLKWSTTFLISSWSKVTSSLALSSRWYRSIALRLTVMGTGESEPTNSDRSQTSASGFFTWSNSKERGNGQARLHSRLLNLSRAVRMLFFAWEICLESRLDRSWPSKW